eukprot:CAMPEP_0196576040 /NCGR_PEP_ID=MMETSP1081-20130531/5399_1 /TAXON_ID=36882 /ORGANISM="Pyramimonas amylifera, Strain CCMP720" /LENGTH=586 /DNA_ID=CAMNT_0041894535 /DNA_START=90 /DNA_END=1850 /DNA_ORIENTATION=+
MELSVVESASYATPAEWLAVHRLQKFAESVERIGCLTLLDMKEVLDEDLGEMGMPPLQRRRFVAAAEKIPNPNEYKRSHAPASALLAKVGNLAALPSESADKSYDMSVIQGAADEVLSATANLQLSATDPWQWLEDYRLGIFRVNFEGLGIREIVDFTEVLDQDLMAMGMPLLQYRRFRKYAADIPPAGGSSYRLDLYAAETAAKAEAGTQVKAWLQCLRLAHFEEKFVSIGIRLLRDLREIREDDLVAMGMPLLQRRRFLMSSAVATPKLPESAEAALAIIQNASSVCTSVSEWLEAILLDAWIPNFDALGAVDIVDFKEVMRSDLEEMELPMIQVRRYLAAVAIIPDPLEMPGRRWETPIKWLESLRLGSFEGCFNSLGVDRVVDFGEVLDVDLLKMNMSPIQRRRFRTACAADAQPTMEGELLSLETDTATLSVGGLNGEDMLNLNPSRWLGLIRCENFLKEFEELGCEAVVDFAEVTDDDLTAMGLPLLQRRRFTLAAVRVEEVHLFHKDRDLTLSVASADSAFQLLKTLRLVGFIEAFQQLGVEDIPDFPEVLSEDLIEMGMKPLHRRRFQGAISELSLTS